MMVFGNLVKFLSLHSGQMMSDKWAVYGLLTPLRSTSRDLILMKSRLFSQRSSALVAKQRSNDT